MSKNFEGKGIFNTDDSINLSLILVSDVLIAYEEYQFHKLFQNLN